MTSTADVDANMEAVHRLVREAALRGAELVLVPECFAYLGPEKGKIGIAESLDDGGPRCGLFQWGWSRNGSEASSDCRAGSAM